MTQFFKHVFVTNDDEVFVSPNSSTLPYVPPMTDAIPEWTTPRDTQTLSWSDNGYPFLGFVLLSDQFTGPIFQRLSFTMRSLPMECYGNLWRLSPETQYNWARLEEALDVVISYLLYNSRVPLPVDFIRFRLPSKYGWGRTVADERYARKLALRARDAFIPLMALCSFAISLYWRHDPDPATGNPKWVQVLLEQAHVHPEWVRCLQESPVANFSPGQRVGVIVHSAHCHWVERIPGMVHANVPVWVYWGHVNSIFSLHASVANIYRPSSNEIQASRAYRDAPEMQQVDAALPELYPEPERYSGQKRGESWQQFFARRDESNTKRIARENHVERQRRQNREREAKAHSPPGHRGPVVFKWHDIDGFRIRSRVFRGCVDTIWESYGRSQRRFDSCRNEWDICTEFDPDDHPDSDPEDNFSDYYGDLDAHDGGGLARLPRTQTPLGPPPYTRSPSAPPPMSHWREDLVTVYNEAPPSSSLELPPLANMLYYRYGFVYSSASHEGVEPNNVKWSNVKKILVDADASVDKWRWVPIIDFINRFLQGGNPPDLPGSIWDLNPSSELYLCHHANPLITVDPIKIDNETYYLVKPIGLPASHDVTWKLVLFEAATVLQCLRLHWGPSLVEVARGLLEMGIPFSTRLCVGPPYPTLRKGFGSDVTLGWREQGYKPDYADYAAYATARDGLLRLPHARAALLKGGIVWRLAIEVIGCPAALEGPSDNVLEHGHLLTSSDGYQLWDDDLSEVELDLICGVYKVYTGKRVGRTNHEQVANMSWWPKHSVWMKGGLNVGYWSQGCENWFQRRLEAIRCGTATLRTVGQWKEALKFHKKTSSLFAANERAATTFLTGF